MPNIDDLPTAAPAAGSIDDAREGTVPAAQQKVLSLENVARMFQVSRFVLRGYELRGLIARDRVMGRVRVYSWADCDRIAFIIKCRKAGIPLASIQEVLVATDSDVPAAANQTGQARCTELVLQLEQRRRVLDEALSELRHAHRLISGKVPWPR